MKKVELLLSFFFAFKEDIYLKNRADRHVQYTCVTAVVHYRMYTLTQ